MIRAIRVIRVILIRSAGEAVLSDAACANHRLREGHLPLPYEPSMDSLWIPYGPLIDPLWIPYGPPLDPIWTCVRLREGP